MTYKIGSLFDGSGGFPLAASMCGIEPVWASEVEPYPIAVTRSRFPDMVHLGDISKINGAEIEPVDVITFGSPCQDLSVAGKRAGLKHEANGDEETTRSGLFMEAVRIIKEMRKATNGEYPTFAVWENVPGAFSSNKGEDFRIVLEELIKIVEPCATVPPMPKGGWPYADCYLGTGWSAAYRLFDAQYWGVPQRRRRVHLVADFRGERAAEVLFEREGVRGYFETGRTPRKGTAADAERSIDADDRERNSLIAYSFDSLASNSMKSKNPHSGCRAVEVAKTLDTSIPDPSKNQGGVAIVQAVTALVIDAVIPINDKATRWQGGGTSRNQDGSGNGLGIGTDGDPSPTLTAGDRHAVCYAMQAFGKYAESDIASAMKARDYKDATDLVVEELGESFVYYIVRRLTPTECARLQGFADRWGDIDQKDDLSDAEYAFWLEVRNTHAAISGKAVKEYTKEQMLKWYNRLQSDGAEYKMWGNGIALPPALYVMQGITDAVEVTRGCSN